MKKNFVSIIVVLFLSMIVFYSCNENTDTLTETAPVKVQKKQPARRAGISTKIRRSPGIPQRQPSRPLPGRHICSCVHPAWLMKLLSEQGI